MTRATELGQDVMLQRRLRAYELALDTSRRDAVQAAQMLAKLSARIAELELELSRARELPAKLEARLAEQEREARDAQQRAHSERVFREDLQTELAALERAAEPPDTADAGLQRERQRERELEQELERLRRLGDESEHVIAASQSARERAEQRVVELTEQVKLLTEQAAELRARVDDLTARVPDGARAAADGADGAGGAPERARLATVLAELRAELDTLRALAEHETEARDRAEQRVAALEAELHRGLPGELRGASTPTPVLPALAPELLAQTPAGGPVEPGRFEAALARLREATFEAGVDAPPTAPEFSPELEAELAAELERAWSPDTEQMTPRANVEVAPIAATLPWIGKAIARLADRDPEAAGGLVLELLVAQRAAHPDPIAYDIELTGMPCLQMTIDGGGQRLISAAERRPAGEVRFAINGDRASFGRLMVAGRFRRRFSRRVAKVDGDRSGLGALDAIMAARLTIAQLRELGLQPDALAALEAAAPGSPSHSSDSAANSGASV